MKKNLLMKTAFAVMLCAAFASCKKDNNLVPSSINDVAPDIEIDSLNEEIPLRQADYSILLDSLIDEYEIIFDFDNMKYGRPSGLSSPHIIVAPSTWVDNQLMTIMIDGAAHLIGFYLIQFTSGFESEAAENIESQYFSFQVEDVDSTPYTMFYGEIGMSIPGYSDYLNVYNQINTQGYSYPIFGNVTPGFVNLGYYDDDNPFDVPVITPQKLALRAAVSFYNNFYDD